MNDIEHDKIELKIEGVLQAVSNRFASIDTKLDSILEQTSKTNGRVTKLEKKVDTIEEDLTFIRAARKRKWLIAVFGLAALQLAKMDVTSVIKKLIAFI